METNAAKKTDCLFYIILGYYVLTSIFYFWPTNSFLKDVIIAPLYFLFPTGIGLLLLSVSGIHKKLLEHFTKLQIILILRLK